MGKLESEARRQRKRGHIQNALLLALGISGAMAFPVAALAALQIGGVIVTQNSKFKYQFRGVASRLAAQGLVKFVNGKPIELTERGRREFNKLQERAALKARSGKRWDKRWRMLMYDIPEKYRSTRQRLRATLQDLGFCQVQDSVWIYPHDCEDLVTLLKAELRVGYSVLYAIVDKLEGDEKIKRHFNLK